METVNHEKDGVPIRGSARFLPYLPMAVLCVVAASQFYLTRTTRLTPWKGGGFGMFSTTDFQRSVRIWVLGSEGRHELEDSAIRFEADRAGEFPSDRRLQDLARDAAALERRRGTSVSGIHIQIWSMRYDRETMAPDPELLREVTFSRDQLR